MANPKPGEVFNGYRYNGGNPNDEKSWSKVDDTVDRANAARDFSWIDRATSALTPAAPLLLAADAAGGDVKKTVDQLRRAAFQGGSFGFGDEALAAARSVVPGGPGYGPALTADRANTRQFAQESPILSTGANITGALATTPMLPVMAPVKGASLLANALRSGATGAGYGAAAGFGQGEGVDSRLMGAATGGALGFGIGAAIPPAVAGASAVGRIARESAPGRWVGQNVIAPAYDAGSRVAGALAPKTTPKSLSAAAPEGGQPMMADGPAARISEMLRARADAARNVSQRGALERLADKFTRDGLDPQALARELQNIGEGGVLANAGGVTTQRLARTAYDMTGPAPQIIDDALTAQRAGAPRRMQSAFEGREPPPTITDAQRYLQLNKGQVGADVYGPLRSAGVKTSDDMTRLLEVPAVREAYDQIIADAAKYGRKLTPFDIAHGVKRQLNLNADAAQARGIAVNRNMLSGAADDWERALYEANPGVKAADQTYAGAAKLPDLLEQGRQFLRTGTTELADSVSPSALAATLPQLDDASRLAFRVGATNTARDIALSGPGATRRLAGNIDENVLLQEKLAQIYGSERAAAIIRQAGAERSMLRTDAAIRGNSNTASKLAHLVDDGLQLPNPATMGSPANLTARLWDAGVNMLRKSQAGNEPVRAEMARMLMEGNPSANLQTLNLIEELMRRRLAAQLRAGQTGAGASVAAGGISNGP